MFVENIKISKNKSIISKVDQHTHFLLRIVRNYNGDLNILSLQDKSNVEKFGKTWRFEL